MSPNYGHTKSKWAFWNRWTLGLDFGLGNAGLWTDISGNIGPKTHKSCWIHVLIMDLCVLRIRIFDSSDKTTSIIPKITHVTPCQRGWTLPFLGTCVDLSLESKVRRPETHKSQVIYFFVFLDRNIGPESSVFWVQSPGPGSSDSRMPSKCKTVQVR